MTPRVFTFWTGPRTPFIELCLRSIAKNSPGSECWTLEQWQAVYDDRFGPWLNIARLRPNQQSDILRCWLLATYGGIWLDADCILFRDLRPLWSHIETGSDIVTYQANTKLLCTALLAADRNSELIARYCRLLTEKLAKRTRWHPPFPAFGPVLFQRALVEPMPRIKLIPHRLIHPLPRWGKKNRLMTPEPYRFQPESYGFMLTHRVINAFPANTERECLESLLPAGQAFRKALL